MSRILTTSIFVLALTAGTALAQPPAAAPGNGPAGQDRALGGRLGGGGLAALDTDKDGVISKSEWIAAGRKAARFDMLDLNKDGKLDRQEIAAARGVVRSALGGQAGAGRRGLRGGLRGAQPDGGTAPPAAPAG